MKPYFEINHPAGLLFLIATMAWGAMELAAAARGKARPGLAAAARGSLSFRP